jgi:hypothetical protein
VELFRYETSGLSREDPESAMSAKTLRVILPPQN